MRLFRFALFAAMSVILFSGCTPKTPPPFNIEEIEFKLKDRLRVEEFDKIFQALKLDATSTENVTNWVFESENIEANLTITPQKVEGQDLSPEKILVYFSVRGTKLDRFFKSGRYRAEHSKLAVYMADTVSLFLMRAKETGFFTKSFAYVEAKGMSDIQKESINVGIYKGEYGTITMHGFNGKSAKIKKGDPIDNAMLAYIRGYSFEGLLTKRMKNYGIESSDLSGGHVIAAVEPIRNPASRRVDVRITFPVEGMKLTPEPETKKIAQTK